MHELAGQDDGALARGHATHGQGAPSRPRGVTALALRRCDPEEPPASELLAAMRAELNDTYETFSRLDNPPLVASGAAPARWLLPGGLRARRRRRRGRAAPARGRRARRSSGCTSPRRRARVVSPWRCWSPSRTTRDRSATGWHARHRTQAGARAGALPLGRLRGGGAVQRQPVRLLLGREGSVLTRPDSLRTRSGPVADALGDHAWAACTVAA